MVKGVKRDHKEVIGSRQFFSGMKKNSERKVEPQSSRKEMKPLATLPPR